MNNKIHIFIDDIRFPFDCTHYLLDAVYRDRSIDWSIVRNYEQFEIAINQIIEDGNWDNIELITFDHDLSDVHYSPLMYKGAEAYNKLYDTFKEKTGYDCANLLITKCQDNNLILPPFLVHSMNPVGKENILSLLNQFKEFQQNNKS